MVAVTSKGTKQTKKRPKRSYRSNWRSAVRAGPFKGGGILRPIVTELSGGDGLLMPSPRSYAAGDDRQPRAFDERGIYQGVNGFGKNDPVRIVRSHGSFVGSNVVRFALSLSEREETERPYEENFVVRSALKAFASGMNQLPFELWDGPPTEKASSVIEDHPLLDLLRHPNRLQSGFEMTKAHTIDYKHDGEVFWFLMNRQGKPVQVNESNGLITEFPTQILAVRGDNVEHRVDDTGMPIEYRYGTRLDKHQGEGDDGKSEPFPWQAVIPFIEYDPYNMVRGLGDVRALLREIDLMFQAYRYLDASVKNGGDPGGFITFDESIGQDELDSRQAIIDDTYTNENAGRYKILDRKAKFTPNPVSPKDMEWSTLFDWSLKAICAGIGTPPPVIGWYDNATYNNLDGARREMWSGPNGILSYAAGKQDVMREKLIRRLSGTAEIGRTGAENLYPFYNPSQIEVLKADRSEQIERASKVAGSGVGVSFNEALAMSELDVEPAVEGDTAYVHTSLREVGEPSTSAVALAVAGNKNAQPNKAPSQQSWVEVSTRAEPLPSLTKAVRGWLGSYESQILVSLRVFASGGKKPSARGGLAVTARKNSKQLTLADLRAMSLNEREWSLRLGDAIKIPLATAWRRGLKAAHKAVGGGLVPITDPRVVNAIANQVILISEGVGSTTAARVRRAILRVLTRTAKEGTLRSLIRDALPELTKELRAVFATKDARALVISITETNSATEAASFLQMTDAGIKFKRWKHAGDSLVRPPHVAMQEHGAIPIKQKFPNGGLHPLDVNLSASQRIGCRCHLEAELLT